MTPRDIDTVLLQRALCISKKCTEALKNITKIDQIETMIIDIPTIRGHVRSMATMTTQSAVLVRMRFSDGSEGIGEGTINRTLDYCVRKGSRSSEKPGCSLVPERGETDKPGNLVGRNETVYRTSQTLTGPDPSTVASPDVRTGSRRMCVPSMTGTGGVRIRHRHSPA